MKLLSLPFFDTQGFPDSSVGKESTCNAGDPRLIPGSRRSTGEGIGYPFQCSDPENSMDGIVCGVAKSRTQLSEFHFHLLTHYGLHVSSPHHQGQRCLLYKNTIKGHEVTQ